MRHRLFAWLALAFPILAWGLSFPSIKAALVEFPPMTLALGRFVLAAVVLTVWYLLRRPREAKPTPLRPRERWSLGLSVFTGITLYFLFENHGVKLIPATAASLIIAGIPVLNVLAERLVFGTRLGVVGTVAAVVSLVGATLLVAGPGAFSPGTTSAGDPWGYVLMLGAAIAWVLYLFAMNPLQKAHSNLRITMWQMIWGAVGFLPFALAEMADWRLPSLVGWGHLAFQGLACSAASYLLYNVALERLGRSTASLAVNLIPVVTAVAAWALLGETLGPWQWVGGLLVLGAVVAVSRPRP